MNIQVSSDDNAIGIIDQVPNAALIWRLSIVREVVFSGFQLDLYSVDERPFAYWYVAQVIEAHLSRIDKMMSVISHGRCFLIRYLSELTPKLCARIRSLHRVDFSITIPHCPANHVNCCILCKSDRTSHREYKLTLSGRSR